jgi:hypothetical protein
VAEREVTSYLVGSPKFTAGHPAPLIALVHHRMVGTLRSTDAALTATDGRAASTTFGVGSGCGRTGHPTSAHVHQYVRLGDQAWGNGNWDPSGAWDDRYPTTLVNSRTASSTTTTAAARQAPARASYPRPSSLPRSRSMPCCCAATSPSSKAPGSGSAPAPRRRSPASSGRSRSTGTTSSTTTTSRAG